MTVPFPHEVDPKSGDLTREELVDTVLKLAPAIKQRMQASLPKEISDELANVTWHQVEALSQLAVGDPTAPGATMSDIARLQHCALSSATALVDRLIMQGLAERKPDPVDRRVIRIAPTAAGEALLRRFQAGRRRLALQALSALTDKEIATLISLLRKVASADSTATSNREVAHG